MEENNDERQKRRNEQAMEYSIGMVKRIMEEESLLHSFDRHIEEVVDKKLDKFEEKLKNDWKKEEE